MSNKGFLALVGLTALLLATGFAQSFWVAPVEMQMGIVQKIFYVHVPSAYAMYLSFIVCAVGSAAFLLTRQGRWDAVAIAGAQVGLTFCAIVLITGPLWARKAWGVWWRWDPRLTTTLLAGMVFVAYAAVRDVDRRFGAGLAVLGLLDLPLIHYSVRMWRGQHPTVITGQGGGLAPGMGVALGTSFVAFTALAILLIWARTGAEMLHKRAEALELELAERGIE